MGHYDELGVAPSASTAEIRTSYLALARRFHPDRLAGRSDRERTEAASRMARINAAWTVLGDRDRRAHYDAGCEEPVTATGSFVRDAGDDWQPFDATDDEDDPRLLDDTPTGAPTLRRELTFLPATLGAAGVLALIVGFAIGLGALAATGLLLVVASAIAFLAIPLIALARSSRADRL